MTTTTTAEPTFTMSRTIPADFAPTLDATRAALERQGFGIITEIDLAATLRAKLGVESAEQVILGACIPGFAHRATELVPSIATVLPCNVVVRRAADGDGTEVEMFDPATMTRLSDDPDLPALAAEVRRSLAAALHAVDPTAG